MTREELENKRDELASGHEIGERCSQDSANYFSADNSFKKGWNACANILLPEIENFRTGVNNFKCQMCGHFASPHMPVDLIAEISRLEDEIFKLKEKRLLEDSDG